MHYLAWSDRLITQGEQWYSDNGLCMRGFYSTLRFDNSEILTTGVTSKLEPSPMRVLLRKLIFECMFMMVEIYSRDEGGWSSCSWS